MADSMSQKSRTFFVPATRHSLSAIYHRLFDSRTRWAAGGDELLGNDSLPPLLIG